MAGKGKIPTVKIEFVEFGKNDKVIIHIPSRVNKEDKDDIWKKMESKRKMGSPLQRRFNSKTTIFENLVVDPYFYPIPSHYRWNFS